MMDQKELTSRLRKTMDRFEKEPAAYGLELLEELTSATVSVTRWLVDCHGRSDEALAADTKAGPGLQGGGP